MAADHFAIQTATAPVKRQAAQINVFASGHQRLVAAGRVAASLVVPVREPRRGRADLVGRRVLRLDIWTDAFTGVPVLRSHGPPPGHGRVSGHQPRAPLPRARSPTISTASTDNFKPGLNKEIGEAVFPPGNTGLHDDHDLGPRRRRRGLALDEHLLPGLGHQSDRRAGARTHTLSLDQSDFQTQAGNGSMRPFTQTLPLGEGAGRRDAGSRRHDRIGTARSPAAVVSQLQQNDVNDPVAKITLQANSGAAAWTGLKLDRWLPSTINCGNGSYKASCVQANKASDVKNIKVWVDTNGDGVLDAGDQQVSPLSTAHNFPTVALSTALLHAGLATGASIYVGDITGMLFTSEGAMPGDTFNRLILNDGQLDETQKEVVYCYGVDLANNKYTNCSRGQENTGIQSYPAGTIISGPTRIPIESLVGGSGQLADRRVAGDGLLRDLRHRSSRDGLQLGEPGPRDPDPSYFQIATPKQLSPFNIGLLTTGGESYKFISQLNQYPNLVTVTPSDAVDPLINGVQAPFLQQRSTVAVAVIDMRTNVSDALWRWIVVQATGTSAASGANVTDVDLVSLWYDANNSGIFSPTADVLVGTGTFGNFSGDSSVAQIKMTTPVQVVTVPLAPSPQRYFVAYHISPTAQPTDPITQKPRTLGVAILATALPTNSSQDDDPLANALALPNTYDPASPLPFASKLRVIIPAPQVMSVLATPYFSTSSGTFPAPTLANAINTIPAAGTDRPDLGPQLDAGPAGAGARRHRLPARRRRDRRLHGRQLRVGGSGQPPGRGPRLPEHGDVHAHRRRVRLAADRAGPGQFGGPAPGHVVVAIPGRARRRQLQPRPAGRHERQRHGRARRARV